MAMMWSDDILEFNHVDTEHAGGRRGVDDTSETPSPRAVGAHPSLGDCLVTGLLHGSEVGSACRKRLVEPVRQGVIQRVILYAAGDGLEKGLEFCLVHGFRGVGSAGPDFITG